MESEGRTPAVFLDRDGTLMPDVPYCSDPAKVHIFDDTPDALRRLKAAGFKLFMITNQSGIGRGYFTEAQYHAVARETERQIGPGLIDATYFCPDAPDAATPRRKPGPGMVLEAARDHRVDLTRSFVIGDRHVDIECGRNAGVRTILVQNGRERNVDESHGADWEAPNLSVAADIILQHAN